MSGQDVAKAFQLSVAKVELDLQVDLGTALDDEDRLLEMSLPIRSCKWQVVHIR